MSYGNFFALQKNIIELTIIMASNVKISQHLINKLIDKKGTRKYFKQLNPKLVDAPFEIDIKSIKKKCKILLLMPNFNWIDEDVNALWDLIPVNFYH